MLEFYPEIRLVHLLTIGLSGLLMLTRGLGRAAGQRWPRHMIAWIVDWTVVATLVTAGVLLVTLLPAELLANHWLSLKLAFVAAYFALGYRALLAAIAPRARLLTLAAAMVCYLLAYGVARAHDPWGWLSGLIG